jgi:cobalt-zinc-cadmium efflux system membrane fusion protein
VHLSAEALSRADIRLGRVERGTLGGGVELPAEIELNPDRVAHISPLIEGQLLSVHATLGARVESKATLAKLRSVELGQARAELRRARSMRTLASQNLERQRKLREEGISSERSLLEAQQTYEQANAEYNAAESRLRVFGMRGGRGPDMTLESPISGVVVQRHATRGENVSPEDTLFVVADLSTVWVMGRAYEQQVSRVAPGMRATLTLSAYPTRTWTGTVDFVGATLDDETRTLPVRVELDNPDGTLRPGLFGALSLAPGRDEDAVVIVPRASIQTLENRAAVFVPGEERGSFAVRHVTPGREGAGFVEIVQGLRPGDSVVVEGAFVLKSELMRGELGHGHAH